MQEFENQNMCTAVPISFFDAPSLGTLHLNYFNEVGKNMGHRHFSLGSGINKLSLDFTRFGNGIYYIQFLFGNLECSQRVVKIAP